MKEADAMWEHVPVRHGKVEPLGEYWNWHMGQLKDAIESVMRYSPEALRLIPDSGFHVLVGRWIQKWKSTGVDNLVTVVSIEEDDHRWTYPRVITIKSVVDGMVNLTGLESLGSNYNPLLTMLEDIADVLPKSWPAYLRWRKRHHREPIPDWLMKLGFEPHRRTNARLLC